ncbi:TetR/AcrR family transcriptional regulator [Yinghuangia seranimata]|uniref:TetR/AcrR family transcriptional regulator n=1 Tax=Yinghuangia seranimata TaxID=408067 RepID=UPI00248CFD7F|nr:TetR/AcrR family transcriptional regulator [Yinghuangia seranimata]MDI2132488.1 helix-turn-helix domain-containing protein [Yinghuangia seranimata]
MTATSSRASTRERLLLTAERLFALHGIDAVSLRQISVAAGQRNNSAAQYHFGTKEDLVRAIFAFRLASINRRREDMVDVLVRAGLRGDLRALTDAMVRPLAEQIDGGGSFYVRFLARVHQHAGASVYALPAMGVEGSVTRIGLMIGEALAHLPAPVRRSRLQLGGSLLVHATADREQRVHDGMPEDVLPPAAFVADLVDSVVGIFSAPVSQDTVAALAAPGGAVPAAPAPPTAADAEAAV